MIPQSMRLLSSTEAARALGISDSRLAKHRRDGDGPPFVREGARYRYPAGQLREWHRQSLIDLGLEVPVDEKEPCDDCRVLQRESVTLRDEIRHLEHKVNTLRDRLSSRELKVETAIADQFAKAREINAVEPHKPHVYILWSVDNEPLYVGQSKNVLARVGQHARSGDERWALTAKVQLIPCATKRDMDRMEVLLISQYQPRFNVTHRERTAS